ncbi:MAG: hypothetical protein HQL31_03345 [Planctomycetes bacterium]|nr:hypothetical protein [Planctomycetota bacterium]
MSKKKQVIMSIESDGRIREFNSIEDAAHQYQIVKEEILEALDTKARVKRIWFRRKADKVINKTRMS